jgi:DUF2075 family protein/predicted GIY-YIG superfamily endonuclease
MSFKIRKYAFSKAGVAALGEEEKENNWPVIYQIYNNQSLYVGETTNLKNRMFQHLDNEQKSKLDAFSVIFDDTFNKSVALDLEAQLIQWFSGEGKYDMLNRNDGMSDRDYFDRKKYRDQFIHIWEALREKRVASKSVIDIENSGLFKFSPYKVLNEDQLRVVNEILIDLDSAFTHDERTLSVVGGHEGTGKTIVLIYLIKLIRDIQDFSDETRDEQESEQAYDVFFKSPFKDRFEGKTIAVVIPNPSLKGSISKIFKSINNLKQVRILSPIEFGLSSEEFDITFVDEAHLLKLGNQEVQEANRQKVREINEKLFSDKKIHTELDWIVAKSRNVVMVYGDQRIRPNNITSEHVPTKFVREHVLKAQMRSKGGELYIDYLRSMFSDVPPRTKQRFDGFEFKLFASFRGLVNAIREKEERFGLSRLVAGFSWKWKSKIDKNAYDIEIDGVKLRWNSTQNDWVGSKNSANEVGSIYTIQGYDLNYCGVIIGEDLKFDTRTNKIVLDKTRYTDPNAKRRNQQQLEAGVEISDDELLDQVKRIYRILMNRSIMGTYVYVCDKSLREYLAKYIEMI